MSKVPRLIKGSDAKFTITLRDEKGDPFPLAGMTLTTVRFKKQGSGVYEVNSNQIPAVQATGTITVIADAGLAGATITIDTTVLTEGSEWTLTIGDNDATAASIKAAIDAAGGLTGVVTASVSSSVVTITAVTGGEAANSLVLSSSDNTNLATSAGTLEDGVDAFFKVSIFDEHGIGSCSDYLGKLQVCLTDSDTSQLRLAKRMTVSIIIDKGSDRTIAHLPDAISVLNEPV